MYETRWIKYYDGMIRFLDIYQPIDDSLEELQSSQDIETSLNNST